jgi:hypothetical protein
MASKSRKAAKSVSAKAAPKVVARAAPKTAPKSTRPVSRKGSAPVVTMDRAKASKKAVKQVKTVVTAKMDRQVSKPGALRKVTTQVTTKVDRTESKHKNLKQVKAVIHAAPRKRLDMTPQDFDNFFQAEIDEEINKEATIHNDRFVRWRCQCCDEVLRVPRRAMTLHGEYVLVHDDQQGLLVNGERWVPKAGSEGGLQLVQPGRLKDPFTGTLIKTGKYAV